MNPTVGYSQVSTPPQRSRLWLFLLLLVIVLPVCLFAAWVWITLHFVYSKGERAGYVQKISQKGWVCKTWEGELAMSTFPGTAPQIFTFSVRDDIVAKKIEDACGSPKLQPRPSDGALLGTAV